MNIDRSEAVNLASNIISRLDTGSYDTVTDKGVKCLADAVIRMDRALAKQLPRDGSASIGRYIDLYREHCGTTPLLNNQECEVIRRLVDETIRASPPEALGEGCKLVPVEPNNDMMAAGAYARHGISMHGAAAIYQDMLAAAPNLEERKMSWIPFKERRPEPRQFVLAYGDVCQGFTDGPKISVFRWHMDRWWDANMDAEEAEGDPSHWMPLPYSPGMKDRTT
ncbi:MAG: DUF551 domain-containing protein [Candidatus Nanopelagicales bacterium]|nr:DUF551 domain-containing protein [Candidatus Nanopelagicales bacterium]